MAYINPAELLAQHFQPKSNVALNVLPQFLAQKRHRDMMVQNAAQEEARLPLLQAQISNAQMANENMKKAIAARNVLMGGSGQEFDITGIDPNELTRLKTDIFKKEAGVPTTYGNRFDPKTRQSSYGELTPGTITGEQADTWQRSDREFQDNNGNNWIQPGRWNQRTGAWIKEGLPLSQGGLRIDTERQQQIGDIQAQQSINQAVGTAQGVMPINITEDWAKAQFDKDVGKSGTTPSQQINAAKLGIWARYIENPNGITDEEKEFIGIDDKTSEALRILFTDMRFQRLKTTEEKLIMLAETMKLLNAKGAAIPQQQVQQTNDPLGIR